MNKEKAVDLVKDTFENQFDKDRFIEFIKNLLKKIDEKTFIYKGNYIKDSFEEYVEQFERIGKYSKNEIDILVVYLKKETSLEHARTMQRNYVARYLNGSRGGKLKDAALVAFVSPNKEDWRFSLVKMDYKFEKTANGKMKVREEFTPARRWSFLVGKNESSHTAQSRFVPLIADDSHKPTLAELEEAFNIEKVTKEFFEKYRDLFLRTKAELDRILKDDPVIKNDFEQKGINTVDFTKKLLGQIVFLYFLQKKGWFGVGRNAAWGTGSKKFLRELFEKKHGEYNNFFNDILEPLFYEALRIDRSHDDHYYSRFDCKIPFLNGGLFDPINEYDWVNTDINLPNELFSNSHETEEGDKGDGILDIFDRYNFTVKEDEPLEKEVAIDPELLGKTYEKFNAIRPDNYEEFKKALKSGNKGEESKFNKQYGVYYTPREIVHYMCQQSLIEYLSTELPTIPKEDIETLIHYGEHVSENEAHVEKLGKETDTYSYKLPETIRDNAEKIDEKLATIKVCDPAVGSGAFPVGMMTEIVKVRNVLSAYIEGKDRSVYRFKRECIENSLYGVDIDPGAVEIAKLRLWLSLIVDEEDIKQIKPLPNLDYKIVCGNSLLSVERNLFNDELFKELEKIKHLYFNETNPTKKQEYKKQIDELISKITNGHTEFDFNVYFSEVFHLKGGFDVVIGNPPYVSTKGVSENDKKALTQQFGFADDLYNHFYFKGIQLLKEKGILTYISSKTFWTIQTKKNLRQLILENKLLQLVDTANPFESAMVDTCITIVQNDKANDYEIYFIDISNGWDKKQEYKVKDIVYKNVVNNVFFKPNELNMKIYELIGKKLKPIMEQWWDKISTSKNIEKFKRELEQYRQSLKPGDITLLGLITEGGQGLATANNGKFIGVLEGTKWADKVRLERAQKLWEFIQSFSPKEISKLKSKSQVQDYLNNLSENQIRELFDSLKEKYGRDIFGQGWLYRIVSQDEIADVEKLTDDEKLNGINGNKTFVPYDKGDKEGNRWWAPTPYYIDWSRENVKFLKENSGKKGEGMPVVRNPQFYFREGFCWNNVLSDEKIKCRLKDKTVHSTEAMTFMSVISKKASDRYLICLLNSKLFGNYRINFVNVSHHLTTGDAKEFPIIIPIQDKLNEFENIFDRAKRVQEEKFFGKISENEAEQRLEKIQMELDEKVMELYRIN
jgi:hypothetical protein